MQADKADHSTTVDILQSLWGIYVYSTWMSNVFQRFAQRSLPWRRSFINHYGCEQNNVVDCEVETNGRVNMINIIQRWIPVFVCLITIEQWECGADVEEDLIALQILNVILIFFKYCIVIWVTIGMKKLPLVQWWQSIRGWSATTDCTTLKP